ncbi:MULTISPECIES: GGDEF domain-containing protein [unclassified Novosphingobium]|uniref:GGDEF domain-containing protein n=1 Tax=unclassified Novosphingobium TaxID=2644732 RepID=UPI00135BC965|nr:MULTISPECIES: GGDEF domain-containing protein [unclassified Novosphingobium]
MTQSDALSEKVYIELVRSLYANVLPSKIMLGITGLYVSLIGRSAGSTLLWAVGLATFFACLIRVGITISLRNRAMTAALDRRSARRLELSYAGPYYLYAALLGALGGIVFAGPDLSSHMLTICVLVGYCAGVATGTGLRPLVAIPSMVMALGPSIAVSALRLEPVHAGMSLIAAAFLSGGAQSVLTQHRMVMTEIGKRLTSVSLARRDGLTALPNRLALREYFDENASLLGTGSVVAVHYLDLDGFKPVNDRYGHAAGDELLAAVAERLRGAVRAGDIVARLGGDEFGIVQFGLNRHEEAELLARRIIAAIAQPFQIGADGISISACVGTVVSSESGTDLETLLRNADAKLYQAKRERPAASQVLSSML